MADNITVMKGLEQGRAGFSYDKVLEARCELGEKASEYKSYVKKTPMLIKTNGLGATLAFIKSKGKSKESKGKDKNAWHIIYQQITDWVDKNAKYIADRKGEDLVKVVVSLETPAYRALTKEILALFNWLRRFVEGLIEGEASD